MNKLYKLNEEIANTLIGESFFSPEQLSAAMTTVQQRNTRQGIDPLPIVGEIKELEEYFLHNVTYTAEIYCGVFFVSCPPWLCQGVQKASAMSRIRKPPAL